MISQKDFSQAVHTDKLIGETKVNKKFEPLESGEVLSVSPDSQILFKHGTFRTNEFAAAFRELLVQHNIGGLDAEKASWLTEAGVPCEVLKFGAREWQKGMVRIHLEFCADDGTEESAPEAIAEPTPAPVAPPAPAPEEEEPTPTPSPDLALELEEPTPEATEETVELDTDLDFGSQGNDLDLDLGTNEEPSLSGDNLDAVFGGSEDDLGLDFGGEEESPDLSLDLESDGDDLSLDLDTDENDDELILDAFGDDDESSDLWDELE